MAPYCSRLATKLSDMAAHKGLRRMPAHSRILRFLSFWLAFATRLCLKRRMSSHKYACMAQQSALQCTVKQRLRIPVHPSSFRAPTLAVILDVNFLDQNALQKYDLPQTWSYFDPHIFQFLARERWRRSCFGQRKVAEVLTAAIDMKVHAGCLCWRALGLL